MIAACRPQAKCLSQLAWPNEAGEVLFFVEFLGLASGPERTTLKFRPLAAGLGKSGPGQAILKFTLHLGEASLGKSKQLGENRQS